jgi:hypothetical protein
LKSEEVQEKFGKDAPTTAEFIQASESVGQFWIHVLSLQCSPVQGGMRVHARSFIDHWAAAARTRVAIQMKKTCHPQGERSKSVRADSFQLKLTRRENSFGKKKTFVYNHSPHEGPHGNVKG